MMDVVMGMMLPVTGVLLATSKKGSYVWLLGLLPLIVLEAGMLWYPPYIPPLLGLGGIIIAGSYIGTRWAWKRRYAAFDRITRTGTQVQLDGHTVLGRYSTAPVMVFANLNVLALANKPVPGVQVINSSLATGMLLLLVGHYLEERGSEEATASQPAKLRPQPGT